jgi:NAD(P)-dependent dehydrogenase (short-subunit alcohol dehydrogenase family)
MRARRSGTIVNVSSIAGQDGQPSCGMYAGSKFALEGLSEALARELVPFNISVLLVEPGAFRTNFLAAAQINKSGLSEPYKDGPVDVVLGKFEGANGKQIGDPAKGVARIFEVVTGEGFGGALKGKILRLPLGSDCVTRLENKLASVSGDLKLAREISLSTDFA